MRSIGEARMIAAAGYARQDGINGGDSADTTPVTPRIRRLRDRLVRDEGLIIDWSILMSESLRKTQGKPMVARRAAAFVHTLANLPVDVDDDELIVGRFVKRTPSPEEHECFEQAQTFLSQTAFDPRVLPAHAGLARYSERGLFSVGAIRLHVAPNARKLLSEGWGGTAERIGRRLGDSALSQDQRLFLESSLLTVRAATAFILRYAALAREKHQAEKDGNRQEELKAIEKVCRRIAAGPATSFRGAIQLIWFQYFLMNAEVFDYFHQSTIGQLDRLLIDFYRQDLAAERIRPADASELIQHLFVQMNVPAPRDWILPVIVGGVGPDGKDASNELTCMCLEAVKALNLLNPSIALRYHRGTPDSILRQAVLMWQDGNGFPQVFNDEIVLASLRNSGVRAEDACQWTHSVCTEITAVGNTNGWISAPYFNMVMPLELVLNGGRSLATGEQIGDYRPTLPDYRDFDDLFGAYLSEAAKWIGVGVDVHNRLEQLLKSTVPQPFLSASVDDCIERARDYTDGGPRYNPSYVQATGISTAVDSLVVLRDLVFSQRRIPADELLEALRDNFEGYARLRALVANYGQRYGNDIPEVDELFVRLARFFYNEVTQHRNTRGGRYYPGFMVFKSHGFLGEQTGATPDGRLAGTALSDSVGAVQGMDRKGLTALFRSVTRTDFSPAVGGVTFNVRLMPSFFDTDDSVQKLIDAVTTYFDLGGFQIQVNVVDGATLRDAQVHPERHRNLMVRVGGFSAYYVTLSKEIQDEIIERTAAGP